MQMQAGYPISYMWLYGLDRIRYELLLSWLVIKSDISATIVPTLLFTIAAWNSASGSLYDLGVALGHGLIYFWLYVLIFCLSNQLVGVDEDRINKPYRPLVVGLVSYRGALIRWAASMLVFSIVGWWFGVLEWALLWQAASVLHNFGDWSKHWLGKHLVMSIGIVAGLAPAWELATPLTDDAWRWIVFLACVILPLIATQDLRDTAGDYAIGRRTFPIAFGVRATRLMLGLCFALLPIAVHYTLMTSTTGIWYMLICNVALTGLSLLIAVRVLLCRTRQADQYTYKLFTYWYCCITASAIVIL